MKKLILLSIILIVGCDILQEEDCAGDAGGTAELDSCDTCDSDPTNDCVVDCAGVWGGNATATECAACTSGVFDCAGICDGTSVEDNCGTCDTDSSNDCIELNGYWGGTESITQTYPVNFVIRVDNISVDWGYGGNPLKSEVVIYDNSSNYAILKWTNHPASNGNYMKLVWLNEPAETVTIEFYSDESTQTEAINSTNVILNSNITKLDEQPVTETALSFAIITNSKYTSRSSCSITSSPIFCLPDGCSGYYDCNCACNGTAEEQTIYYDHDGDGLGGETSKQHCNANALPDGYVLNSDDEFDYLEETECDIYSTLNIPFEEFQIENETLIYNLFGYEYSIDISNCITVTQCPNDEDIWQSYNGGVFTNLNKIVHLPEIKVLLINENEYSADFLMNYSEILFSMPTN